MTTTTPIDRRTRRPHRHRGRMLVAAGLLLLAPLVAAACGGGDDSAGASNGSNGSSASQGDMEAYRACLAENGVNLPQGGQAGEGQQGGGTPPSFDQSAMQQAQTACASLRPQGGFGGGNGQGFQEYLSCLSENGVDTSQFPQPGQGGQNGQPPSGQPPTDGSGQPPAGGYGAPGGGQGGAPFGLDSSDPTVAKAMQACQDKMPQRGQGGPGAQGGGSQGGDATTTTVPST